MTTEHQNENLSFDAIDEMLKPVTEIDFDNQHSDLLWHLHGQLESVSELVELRLNDQTTARSTARMTSETVNTQSIPELTLSPEDFESFNAVMRAPASYRTQIDLRTRLILKGLLNDLVGARDAITNIAEPDDWFSIQVPISVLTGLINGTPPVKLAESWEKRLNGTEETPVQEPIKPQAQVTYRYRPGDFTRALREGLQHENIVEDIEAIMYGLLFHRDDDSVILARELLFDLVNALDARE